jgi:hypothetical protein
MSTTLRSLGRKPVAAIGATVLVVGAAGLATATGSDPQAPPTRGASPSSVEVVKCDGGAQKRVYNRIVSSPFTFGEGAAVAVPGAAVAVPGPAKGTDTLTITFSGEANLTGYTDTDERLNWLGLEVLVDGVPIQPYTAVGDVMAFHGPGGYDMNSATFCTKIRKGPHSVRVRTNLFDGGTNDALTGWLDDYTLSVEQSE